MLGSVRHEWCDMLPKNSVQKLNQQSVNGQLNMEQLTFNPAHQVLTKPAALKKMHWGV
jgi:hypothetical protein